MGKLDGKIAVVTGGTSGIGLGTAREFLREGAFVYITGRRQEVLDAAVKELGQNVRGLAVDSSKLSDLDRLYNTVKQEKGHLDVLFVNAGGGEFAALENITEEHYNKTFDTNVKGLVFTVQKALPILAEGGSIILNGSCVSVKGVPTFSIYAATKAAVRSLARSWTLELKDRKLRVNVLSPGPVDTPGLRGLNESEEETRQFLEAQAAAVPLGRVGDVSEIGKVAVFLASDDSSFVAGVELFADGGMSQI